MKRLTRHVVVFVLFVYLILGVIFLRFWSPDVFDRIIGSADDAHEQEVESWNYVLNLTHELSILTGKREDKLKKLYKSYNSLPGWDDVIDGRTLIDPDYYVPLNLRFLPGAQHRVAAERISQHIRNDSFTLREEIDSAIGPDKIYSVTEDGEVDYLYREGNSTQSGYRWQRLDSTTVERVAPLPPDVPRTPSNRQTHLDPADLAAIHPSLRDKVEWGEVDYFDLPRRRATRPPAYRWNSFYIVLNLFNNEDLLPFLTEALVAFIEDELAPFFEVRTSVVVVIYASISEDLTGPLIRSLLIPYLQKAGVEVIYATVGGSCLGYVERQPFHERIEWLQCVRNKAMQPLQELGMNIFARKNSTSTSFANPNTFAEDGVVFNHIDLDDALGKPRSDSLNEDDLVVLFLNDIFFRPSDLTRLLETEPEAQMATQMPPDGDIMKPANVDVSRYRSKDPMTRLNHSRNPRPLHPGNVGPSSRDPRGSFDIACGMDFYNLFYDTWVARDHLGGNFLPYMPYSDNPTMRSAIARILSGASSEGAEKSTGVFVKSCWNGVGAIRGRLFLPQRGLGVFSEKAASPPRIPPTDSVSATSEVELNEPKGPDEASALRAAKTSLSTPADAPSVGEIDSLATLLNPLLTFAPQAKSPLEQDLFFYMPRRLLCRVLRCDGGDAQGFPAYSTPWWEFHVNAYLNEGTAPQDLPRDIDHPLMASREDSFIPPFRLKVLQVYEHGLCLKVPYITDALSRSPLLQSFRVPSGVIFDRIGKNYSEAPGSREGVDANETKFMMELENHYERILTYRLAIIRQLWHDAHAMIQKLYGKSKVTAAKNKKKQRQNTKDLQAELHAHVARRVTQLQNRTSMQPRQYQENPKRFDQNSARGEVAGLFHWIELLFKVIPVNLGALSNEGQMNSTLKPKVQYVPKQQLSDSYSNFPISRDFSSMDRRYVLNDAVYYKARNPTLHFRHSLMPSFGATILEKGYQVRDGVCLSSECVLLCVDIMHATILREGRTPVILMNPLVQVAYEKSHFDRLTRTRLYTSPTLFYFSTWLSDARQVWQRIKRWLFHPLKHSLPSGDVVMEKFKLARSERTPLAFEQAPEKPNNTIHAEGNPISVISAIDDMLDDTPTCDFYKGPLPVVIGHSGWNGSSKRWAKIDFVRYTSMMCNGYSSNELEILSTWLYWIGITLAIVLQLVFLSRDVNTRIQVKFVHFLSKFDCNGEECRNPSSEEIPPLDWRDVFLLLDSDHALATHSPNLSPRNSPLKLSRGSGSAFIAPIDSLELQKKYQPRGTRLVIPYTINNLSLNTFEIFACNALTTEERLWLRVYGALVTRSLCSTFRPRAALRRWCRRLREVDQAYGVHFLCYRISNLCRVNRMIEILQQGMRKLVSKSRLFVRNRRNLRKFTDLL